MFFVWVLSDLAQAAIFSSVCMLIILAVLTRPGTRAHNARILEKPPFLYTISFPVTFIKLRLKAWSFLIRGPEIIQTAYEKSDGAPFSVDTPSNTIVLVSDWGRIKEINAAPEGTLSLLAAAKEVLQPKHTMSDFIWNDKRGSDGAPLQMTLRSRLTGYLPILLPKIRHDLCALFDRRLDSEQFQPGDIRRVAMFPIVLEAVAQSNAHAFFGSELSRDPVFLKAGIRMIEHTLIIAELLRMAPGALSTFLGNFLSDRLDSCKVMTKALTAEVSRRFENRELRQQGIEVPEQNDCIEWIMNHSPRHRPWGVTRIVHELIALWFGSVHIASTTACAAIFDLCDHPEFVDILRREIVHTGWESFDKLGGQVLPLMDSFMKESARLNPIESVSTRRRVLKPFKFSDGTVVQPGDWVCSAPRGMNRNPSFWSRADEFYIFRFVKPEVLKDAEKYIDGLSSEQYTIPEAGKASAYTDLSDWQQWGTGKASCTGRWYASAAIKTILGILITRYDIELVNPTAKRYFSWRTFIYPYQSTEVTIQRRYDDRSHISHPMTIAT